MKKGVFNFFAQQMKCLNLFDIRNSINSKNRFDIDSWK